MTTLQLPARMAKLRHELDGIVTHIERTVPYGAVLLSTQQGLRISVDTKEERISEQPPTLGTVLTAFNGYTMHEQAVGGFEQDAVTRAARKLVQSARLTSVRAIDPGPERGGDFVTPLQIAPQSLSTAEKLDRCRSLQQRVQQRDPRIVNARVIYSESSEIKVFRNRAADLAQQVQRINVYVLVFVAGEQGVRYDLASKSATGGWEALEFSDDELQAVVDNAAALLSAERIEPGEYTIITTPGVTGTICHESFGHGVETDMFLKERAKAAHFIDKVVGSPLVNIFDDPSYAGAYGQYFLTTKACSRSPRRLWTGAYFDAALPISTQPLHSAYPDQQMVDAKTSAGKPMPA